MPSAPERRPDGEHAHLQARDRGRRTRRPPTFKTVAPLRTTRRKREPPTDSQIEDGLRERAVSDPRAAEILLRWLQRPRERVHGIDLDTMSEAQLEALYAGLVRIAALPPKELQALVDA